MTDEKVKATGATASKLASDPASGTADEGARTPAINWDDPDIPAGNAPSMPRWPLVVASLAFGAWVVFLVAMAVLRYRTTPV